ncbi:hypothetical protein FB382_001863 [Nocardioides ginsengisegetis]|uniref:Uncharacterized protein n=1 Tax=Nocardioides ginsengisegetis TaxID=661491 RepID=A0A7W3IZN1_9ACTN|nr:hypothetical protein [Nocardioides ginsengisegetis]MBA8803572.1 hypothetical protein [Nocardioides ginsengisegetis]
MANRRGPRPESILSRAAALENLTTWIIAASIAKDERAFGWFLHYAADRIPVEEKVKLLGEIVTELPEPTVVYSEFLDDLRFINRVRVQVAHSVFIFAGFDSLGAGYVNFKKGKPRRMSDDDLRTQVADATKRAKRAGTAFSAIVREAGLPFSPPPLS